MPSRPLLPSEIPLAAEAMAEAYVDDPLCSFMLPLRLTRKRSLAKFFRAYFASSAATARVVVAGDPILGVAIWNPPGADSVSVSLSTLRLFVPLLATLYPLGLLRARPAIQAQAQLRSRLAQSAHYYLDNVGVVPSRRGEGVASQLIRPVIAEADAANMPTYTDTFTSTNVPIYEHYGFRCVGQTTESRTGLSIWALHREAPGAA